MSPGPPELPNRRLTGVTRLSTPSDPDPPAVALESGFVNGLGAVVFDAGEGATYELRAEGVFFELLGGWILNAGRVAGFEAAGGAGGGAASDDPVGVDAALRTG